MRLRARMWKRRIDVNKTIGLSIVIVVAALTGIDGLRRGGCQRNHRNLRMYTAHCTRREIMGRLAEIAKTAKLKGAITVSFPDGTSRTFANEALAEKATAGLVLEHNRGAFFVVEKKAETKTEIAKAPEKAAEKKK